MVLRVEKAIVIGAGVVGVATAYALARRGVAVTMIDQREDAGLGTSYANGGQLSYLYTGPLANHRLRSELPGLALHLNPAFRIRLHTDPDFVRWILSFLRNCTRSRYRRNNASALEITLESRLAMLSLLQKHALDFDYQVKGRMQLLYTEKAIAGVKEHLELKRKYEEDERLISFEDAAELEPALTSADDKPLKVLWSPSEAVGDASQFARSLLETLKTDYGVETLFGERILQANLHSSGADIRFEDGRRLDTELLALCTGADRFLMKQLGLDVPLYPMKGYSITAPLGDAPPNISLTDTKRRLVFTRLGDRIRIAGMADLGWTHDTPDPARLRVLTNSAIEALPAAAAYERATELWAGLRPMTPDSNPRIARPHPALIYNLGHGMLGWTMAMGTGERAAKLAVPETDL
ncbi:MAG: amino acid dehydrogenase [Ponticaulis sp.]|nr:amino acid dehydrogenase [Ponticaulis sp.]|tara:strand:+ start:83500 stop:84726 length:1227 start_codon:yes stop_codon:yes gene_type:complete